MTATPSISALDEFTLAYVTCALWSSNDESDESGGVPLDQNHSIEDIAPDSLGSMIADCFDFQAFNADNLALAYERTDYTESSAGHDFWLTRNGHGSGYWDRDFGDVGEALSRAARACGNVDLYIGDDEQIHAS